MKRSPLELSVLALDGLPLCRIFELKGFAVVRGSESNQQMEWSTGCVWAIEDDAELQPYSDINKHLDLLVQQRYIRAFLRESAPNSFSVEVYLIPGDLPQLRSMVLPGVRQDKTAPACRKALLAITNILTAATQEPLIHQLIKTKSLIDAWNDIPPPSVSQQQLAKAEPWLRQLINDINTDNLEGLMNPLYQYQKEDIAAMLIAENVEQFQPDCTFSTFVDARGRTFYMNDVGDVTLEPATYLRPRGGILAEPPGLGKTLIALTLVLATKNRLPTVDVISTPVGPSYPKKRVVSDADLSLRSLLGLCIRKCRLEALLSFEDLEEAARTDAGRLLQQTRVEYKAPDLEQAMIPLKRVSARRGPLQHEVSELPKQKIILSKTTLIVVPEILISHWSAECEKHFITSRSDEALRLDNGPDADLDHLLNEGYLRYRTFNNSKNSGLLPPARDLAKYDILLMSEQYFAKLPTVYAQNPLLQMHFTRIIIDEGHFIGDNRTSALASVLRSNAHWTLSATPTRNLNQFSETGNSQERVRSAQLNNSRDLDDIRKLGSILGKFIKLQPFSSDATIFENLIAKPFASKARGYDRLENIMRQIIIRHRPTQSQTQLDLPPLEKEVVRVSWAFIDRLSYNVILALFLSNSVLTEREGPDYFFNDSLSAKSSKIRTYRYELMQNLREAHFNVTTDDLFKDAQHALASVEEKLADFNSCQQWQRRLLEPIKEALEEATGSNIWRLACMEQDLVYSVQDYPAAIASAFDVRNAFLTRERANQVQHPNFLIAGYRVDDLRNAMAEARVGEACLQWQTGEDLEKQLVDAAYTKADSRRKWLNTTKRPAARPASPKKEESSSSALFLSATDRSDKLKKKAPKSKVKASKAVSAANLSLLERTNGARVKMIPRDFPLLKTRVTCSSSGKLNWIINEILDSADDDRFIVFGDSPFMLFNLVEGLALNDISFYFRATAPDPKKLSAFQSGRSIKVLLLTPAQGARGLHLTTGNRIIFCSPLWRPDDEAQAMLRSHRIGQTRPVRVQILVMEGSFEEQMLARRESLTANQRTEVIDSKSEADDVELRRKLESAQFIWAKDSDRAEVSHYRWKRDAPLLGNTADAPRQIVAQRSPPPDSEESIGSETGDAERPEDHAAPPAVQMLAEVPVKVENSPQINTNSPPIFIKQETFLLDPAPLPVFGRKRPAFTAERPAPPKKLRFA